MVRILGFIAACLLLIQAPAEAKFLDGIPKTIVKVPIRTSQKVFRCCIIHVLYARQECNKASLLAYAID